MRWLVDAMSVCASETFTSTSAPIQYAAIPAFEQFYSNEMQSYLKICNQILRGLSDRIVTDLQTCGASVHKPGGAFYVFPDFTTVPGIEKLSVFSRFLFLFFLFFLLCLFKC